MTRERPHSDLGGGTFTALTAWRILLFALLLICCAFAGMLWLAGERETKDAFESGRRFLIAIDTGEVTGKHIAMPETKPEQAKPEPAKPEPAKPEEAPAATLEPKKTNLAESPTIIPALDAVPGVNTALVEKTADGYVPKIGQDGTKPWRYYSKNIENAAHMPVIAIIVTGLGENKTASDAASKLPDGVTLSFSPYARNAASWVGASRATGHEIMMDLPLEPSGYPASDPGPYGLLVGKGMQENLSRLNWLMSRFTTYTGFVTPQNEVFTGDSESFKPVMQMLAERGLVLALGHPPLKADTTQLIESGNLPSFSADLLVDEDLSADAIQTRFANLEDLAKKRGYAIGIAQSFPISIAQINAWAAHLSEKGLLLVPLSYILKQKFS